MVHHIVLCQLQAGLPEERLEWILRQTRIRLLKIAEVRAIRCGKRIEADKEWEFFFAADYESMDKLSAGQRDPVYHGFVQEVILPHVERQMTLNYESEPDKDVRYS